jgi:hypothetical protein
MIPLYSFIFYILLMKTGDVNTSSIIHELFERTESSEFKDLLK